MAANSRKARHTPWLLFALTGVLLAGGFLGMWPVLLEGHQRIHPWQVPLLWAGDLVALLLFLRFFLTHGIRGQPLLDKPLGRRPRFRDWWPALSLLVAFAADLAYTGYEIYEEHRVRETRACSATGEILDYYRKPYPAERGRPAGTSYHVRYRFRDPQGTWRHGTFSTAIEDGGRPVDPHPPEVVAGLLADRRPLPLRVSYDPDWPARSWARDVPRLFEYGQVFLFSMAFLWGQLVVLPGLVTAYLRAVRNGIVPWWRDLLEAVPLTVEAAVLLLLAVIRYVDYLPRQVH
jgi:hypothetical protein